MRAIILALGIWTSLAAAQQPPDTPAALRVQDGQKLLLKAHGTGTQIYTCKSGDNDPAWTLKGPDALLFNANGKLVAKHYAGPTWKANDGSSVQGKVIANAPAPRANAVPWLLLSASAHEGSGIMTKVENIQRLHTAGGKARAAGCDAAHIGNDTSVHYTADYYFYSAPGQ
jgi:hypothetical protein